MIGVCKVSLIVTYEKIPQLTIQVGSREFR